MKAMILDNICSLEENNQPLRPAELPVPIPGAGEVVMDVSACAVCHTELDEIEGRTPPSFFPMILGHQVIGRVSQTGAEVTKFKPGERICAGWIFSSCGLCDYCKAGLENLCADFKAAGRDAFGGYAEKMLAHQDFVFPVPDIFSDEQAAPLLCAGAIGYRSVRLTGIRDGDRLGLTGFGASGHLVLKMARHCYPKSDVFVFARNEKERAFALELGAVWAGDSHEKAPELLHAVIDTTPAWKPVIEALNNLRPGGRLVINAIRKETADQKEWLRLDYARHLWMEKEIKSVANAARRDIAEFLEIAARIPILPETTCFPLEDANEALASLKKGGLRGALVLRV